MNDEPGRSEGIIRIATPWDIPFLTRHHRMMFEEIQRNKTQVTDPFTLITMEKEYAEKLVRDLTNGTCCAWIGEIGSIPVSSGAVSIMSYVPVPHDLSSRIAFLHSVYTEPEYRHLHFARWITCAEMDYCRDHGIKRLYLFASDAGTPLYEKAGFVSVPNMMVRFLH
jgi:GNAT superfamily N-acetyltransferase